MEQNQDSSLFGLAIDSNSRYHLLTAASWAKFLAIVGFIVCGLVVVAGIFAGSIFEIMFSRYQRFDNNMELNTRGFGVMAAIMYSLLALLYFFPCLFLFRFAVKMKSALLSGDQNILNISFQNLKKTFRYVGVLTIIVLSFYVFALLIALIAGIGG